MLLGTLLRVLSLTSNQYNQYLYGDEQGCAIRQVEKTIYETVHFLGYIIALTFSS